MFESIGTLLSSFNIFGIGIYLIVMGLIFAVSKGIGRNDKGQVILWSLTLGVFATLLLFRDDAIKGFLFMTTAILIIIYGLNVLGNKPRGE